jgi:hypothetical protein
VFGENSTFQFPNKVQETNHSVQADLCPRTLGFEPWFWELFGTWVVGFLRHCSGHEAHQEPVEAHGIAAAGTGQGD